MIRKKAVLWTLGIGVFGLFWIQWTAPVVAYPGGPLRYVTDIGPFCAGCHASTSADQFPEQPREFAAKWTVEKKHLVDLEKAEAYQDLTPAQRTQLRKDILKVDANASVKLQAPARVRPGETFTVQVKTRGGSGPVVGVALVDRPIRFQARPVQGEGFLIVGPPKIVGPDGKPQTKWTDSRFDGLPKNINFAMIFDIQADLKRNRFATGEVSWTLRAPEKKGTYPITAVFFYGTEKASPLGTVERLGKKEPRGGFLGHSGRVMFSNTVNVVVE